MHRNNRLHGGTRQPRLEMLELNFVDNCRNNEKSFHTLTKMKNYYIGEYLGKTGKMLKYLAHGDLIKWKKCGKDCDLAHW